MNQLLYIRKARFIMLRDGRRSLSISTNLFGNNRVMAKQKRTVDVTKPVSYTEVHQTFVRIFLSIRLEYFRYYSTFSVHETTPRWSVENLAFNKYIKSRRARRTAPWNKSHCK